MSYYLKFEGLNKAVQDIEKYGVRKKQEVMGELDRTTIAIESKAKLNLTANGSVKTGLLRSQTLRSAIGPFLRQVEARPKHAGIVEFGSSPHVIYPRTAKALKTPFGFFKKVNHPGSRPKPFLFPAAESEKARYVANLTVILSRV